MKTHYYILLCALLLIFVVIFSRRIRKIKFLNTLLCSFVILFFPGYQEINEIPDIAAVDWIVISILDYQTDLEFPENDYVLKFTSDSTYHINLDINACTDGIFEVNMDGKISFSPMICTYVCCDSDFAEHMLQLLYSVEHYKVFGNTLYLEGEGQIKLYKNN